MPPQFITRAVSKKSLNVDLVVSSKSQIPTLIVLPYLVLVTPKDQLKSGNVAFVAVLEFETEKRNDSVSAVSQYYVGFQNSLQKWMTTGTKFKVTIGSTSPPAF